VRLHARLVLLLANWLLSRPAGWMLLAHLYMLLVWLCVLRVLLVWLCVQLGCCCLESR
jgi:hypothetical protein